MEELVHWIMRFSYFLNGSLRVILPYANHHQTHAPVWIKIYGLPYEYWHPQLLLEIARGVGLPLQLAKMTQDCIYANYARVLVDVDLSGNLPSSLMIERADHGFPVDIVYENLPHKCNTCGRIGHQTSDCRQNKFREDDKTCDRSKAKIIYIPVSKYVNTVHSSQEAERTKSFDQKKRPFE